MASIFCLALPSLLMLLLPEVVMAQPSTAPSEVTAVGTCPSRDAVLAALAPVLGSPRAPSEAAAAPRVADLGDRFEVSAAGQRAQYVDGRRDCGERARIAAVFIALALNPPASESRRPAAVAPPPPGPPPPVAPPAAVVAAPLVAPEPSVPQAVTPRWAAVGIAARVDGASQGRGPSSSTAVVAGADLRVAMGRRWLGAFAAAGILAPTSAQFDSVTVRQQRFPFSVGVTARVGDPGAFHVAGDLGVALALFTLRGQNLETATSEARLDVGGRLAVALRFPRFSSLGGAPIVAFTDVHAEFYPRPYHLDVDPFGGIGRTSRLWLGASVGAWWEGL